jgi:hypothetical protein
MKSGIYVTEVAVSPTGIELPIEAVIVSEERNFVILSRAMFHPQVMLDLIGQGATPAQTMFDFNLN